MVAWESPLFWAVLIGWVLSVVLHELAHGVVAFLGGDYTIRDRGGLSLNPLAYVSPVNSLLMPALFLLVGGVPLPGGVTYVRRDLLRSRWWDAAVSLAGPAANLLLGLGLAMLFHPRFGPLRPGGGGHESLQAVLATLAFLQLFSVILNLLPIPPLDGFQAIAAFLPERVRAMILSSGIVQIGYFVLFMVLWQNQEVAWLLYRAAMAPMRWVGLDGRALDLVVGSVNRVLFGA